jgi:hypothetical protein
MIMACGHEKAERDTGDEVQDGETEEPVADVLHRLLLQVLMATPRSLGRSLAMRPSETA